MSSHSFYYYFLNTLFSLLESLSFLDYFFNFLFFCAAFWENSLAQFTNFWRPSPYIPSRSSDYQVWLLGLYYPWWLIGIISQEPILISWVSSLVPVQIFAFLSFKVFFLFLPSYISLGVSSSICWAWCFCLTLVSWGCWNKWPQTVWLKMTEMYPLSVLEVRHMKPRCWQGRPPSEASREESMHASSPSFFPPNLPPSLFLSPALSTVAQKHMTQNPPS